MDLYISSSTLSLNRLTSQLNRPNPSSAQRMSGSPSERRQRGRHKKGKYIMEIYLKTQQYKTIENNMVNLRNTKDYSNGKIYIIRNSNK